jgi:hypothetical protein
MLTLGPGQPLKRLLLIGAHSDDIEIGCGGTIQRLIRDYPDLEVVWMVLCASGSRAEEARSSAAALLSAVVQREIVLHSFRLVSELTWNTFRDHLILEFEIPKYDGDFGAPNFFVLLDEELVEKKVDHLMSYFPSQTDRHWFTRDLFRSVLRLRGMECNAPGLYAEAFYGRKAAI